MDGQMIINLLAGSALAVIGWFARQLWDAVERLKSDVKDIEICLPSNYVRKQDMSDLKHDMEARFDKLESMLTAHEPSFGALEEFASFRGRYRNWLRLFRQRLQLRRGPHQQFWRGREVHCRWRYRATP